MTLGDIVVRLGADVSGFQTGLANAEGSLQKTSQRFVSLGTQLSLSVTAPILGIGGAVVKMAMDAVESEDLFRMAFGGMADQARDWSVALSKSLGLNEFELRKTSATLFTMFESMGLAKSGAFEMATGLTQLAHDLASFHNERPDEMFDRLRAGITGQTEPLQRLGILINENTIKTVAYKNGIAKQGAELSEQQKVLARYAAILEQTGVRQNNLALTSHTATNQFRILGEKAKQAGIELGKSLLPTVEKGIAFFADMAPKIQAAVKWFGSLSEPVRQGVVVFGLLLAAIGPVLVAIGGITAAISAALPVLAVFVGAFNPVTLAIGGVVAALYLIPGAWDTVKSAFSTAGNALKGPLQTAWDYFKGFVSWLSGVAQNLFTLFAGTTLPAIGQAFMGLARLVSGPVVAGFQFWIDVLGAVRDALGWVWDKLKSLVPGLEMAAKGLKGAASGAWEWVKSLGVVASTQQDVTTETKQGTTEQKKLETGYLQGADAAEFFKNQAALVPGALAKGKDEAQKAREEFDKYVKTLKGADVFAEATKIARAVGEIGGATKLTAAEMVKLQAPLLEALDKYRVLGEKAPPAVLKLAIELDGLIQKTKDSKHHFELLGQEIQKALTPPPLQNAFDPLKFLAPLKSPAVSALGKSFGEKFLGGVNGTLQQLGPTVMQALTGGGNLKGAVGGLIGGNIASGIGKALTSAAPKFMSTALGGALSSVLPGIGAMIGPLIGKGLSAIGNAFKGLFGGVSKEVKEARGEVDSFQKSLAATLTATQRTEAGNEQWKMTVIAVRDAYLATGRTAEEADAIVRQLWDTDRPERARDAIKQINLVLAEQQNKLARLTDLQGEAEITTEKMKAAADRLGVSYAALGPKFNEGRLHETMQTVWDDFRLLELGGADMNEVLRQSAGKFIALGQEAQRFGFAMPANFKAVFEQLDGAGLLTDEFGNKLVDVSQIQFGDPIVAKLDRIADEIKALGDKILSAAGLLNTTLPVAADHMGRALEHNFQRGQRAAEEFGRTIREDVIEMNSPTGLEGIIHYANLFGVTLERVLRASVFEFGIAAKSVGLYVEQFDHARGRVDIMQRRVGEFLDTSDTGFDNLSWRMAGAFEHGTQGAIDALAPLTAYLDGLLEKVGRIGITVPTDKDGKPRMPGPADFISESDAINRINALFREHAGRDATADELKKLAEQYGYKGGGKVLKSRFEDFLDRLLGEHIRKFIDDGGFATGTMGRLGQWFGQFGAGMPTVLHGTEAVITPAQAPAFAMDVLASQGGLPARAYRDGTTAALLGELQGMRAELRALPDVMYRAAREGRQHRV
jgi:hypothetical protein